MSHARPISGAVHDPSYSIATKSTAKDGLTFRCRDCGRRFTAGVNGETRQSGARCIKCLREIFGANYTLDPKERERDTRARLIGRRVRKYGLTAEGHTKLLREQGEACAICCFAPADSDELVVDHNHGTNEVRGLLCSRCNTALGMFGDDPDRLEAAAEYLTERGYTAVERS